MSITFKEKYGDLTGKVYRGSVKCSNLYLDSLEGAPKECEDFDACDNELKSLKHAPQKTNDFLIRRNKLESLEGGAVHVEGNYSVRKNQLKSLKGIATHIGGFLDLRNNEFKDLETILYELGFYKVKVGGLIKTDFADFKQFDVDAYATKMAKMGKFKDFLNL